MDLPERDRYARAAGSSLRHPGNSTIHLALRFVHDRKYFFKAKDTLLLSTDLSNPRWSITKTDLMEDQPPVISTIPVNQKSQVRLDGWLL
jgi:hypothetical protein